MASCTITLTDDGALIDIDLDFGAEGPVPKSPAHQAALEMVDKWCATATIHSVTATTMQEGEPQNG